MATAVKPYIRLIIAVVLIIAGIMAIRFARSRFLYSRQEAESRFVSTYVELSIAKERFAANPDSLKLAYNAVYKKNSTDSLWMANYIEKLTEDINKSERLWGKIVAKYDSLGRKPTPASIDILNR